MTKQGQESMFRHKRSFGLALAGPWPGPGWPLAWPWLVLGLALDWPSSNREIKLTGSPGKINGSGLLSIAQDIIPHVIHDSKCLTVPFLVVFDEESHGYDAESIYQTYELCRFGEDPEVKT